jgi:integrase
MSEVHPTAAGPSGKPAKPYAGFPLTPHATRRWCKKILGRLHYFGRWEDPEGALAEYQAFLNGVPVVKRPTTPQPTTDNRTNDNGKPTKPYQGFPLTAHPSGYWCKKIKGRLHYFGRWDDPDGALKSYLDRKDDLYAGRSPRTEVDGVTVKDVVNAFLNHKKALLDAGELSPRSFDDQLSTCDVLIGQFGKQRLAADLRPDDFAALRKSLANAVGPVRLGNTIQRIRGVFKYAYDAEMIDRPLRFGPGFKRPSKKVLRLHRAESGTKLFTADEIRRMIETAGVPLKAMVLLGINAGMGNSDCGNLPLAAVDLTTGWITYPRPKTGVARRCKLWPQTVEAMRDALAKRSTPKSDEDAPMFFVTKYGLGWAKDTRDNPISKETKKLLNACGIHGRSGIGFYTLRHTFRTIADEAKDQPAVDHIMGHETNSMANAYRETIADERLRAVADYVRTWLYGND